MKKWDCIWDHRIRAGVWGPERWWTVEATFWAREGLKGRHWGGEQRVCKLSQSKCSLLKRNLRVSVHLREFKGTFILFLKCYYIKGKYTIFSFLFYFFFLKFNSVISQISPASTNSYREEPMCTQMYFKWEYLISLHHATFGVPWSGMEVLQRWPFESYLDPRCALG